MKNRTINILVLSLVCLITINANGEDKFEQIKSRIDSSVVLHLEVLITIKSNVFDDIDSAYGQIILADDGRYMAIINDDIYLNDGRFSWEYSAENNQATKRKIQENEIIDNRLAFFKDIDSYYSTKLIKKDLLYMLYRLEKDDNGLPDSMAMYIDKKKNIFSKIEYYDLNDDLNCIYVNDQYYSDKIEDNLFETDLPDSTEIITLP